MLDAEAMAKELTEKFLCPNLPFRPAEQRSTELLVAIRDALTTYAAQQVAKAERETWQEVRRIVMPDGGIEALMCELSHRTQGES